jgi:hypothetical protein
VATNPTVDERRQLDDLYHSLYTWAFMDLRRAREAGLPRLAFIGLAVWIDTVSKLYTSGKHRGQNAWGEFIRRYVPKYMNDVRTLCHGLRDLIVHEYGTEGVFLMNEHPGVHWTAIEIGSEEYRLLDLGALLDEFEGGWEAFYAELETSADLRRRVLPKAKGLLAAMNLGESLSASVAHSVTTAKLFPNVAEIIASATYYQPPPGQKSPFSA